MEGIIILRGTVADISHLCSFVNVKLEYKAMWQRNDNGGLGRKMLTREKNCVDVLYKGACHLVKPELFNFSQTEKQLFGIQALEFPKDGAWGTAKDDLHLGDKVVVFITWEDFYYDDDTVEHRVRDVIICSLSEKPQNMKDLVDAVASGKTDDVTFF